MQMQKITEFCGYDSEKLTPIQEFYDGANILITGGTGFLGKALTNKLLMSCPGIKTIFILVRNKYGEDANSRIEEMFSDPIFNSLKQMVPEFRGRVQVIAGDLKLSGLGLMPSDRLMLTQRVNIVFHMAATIRFNEKLKVAMFINVQSTRDLMSICSEMENVKSVVHLSTAYMGSSPRIMEEKFYSPTIDSDNMLLLAACTPEKLLETMTPTLLGKSPNTYAFTKTIAEDIIHKRRESFPVGIFRPSLVLSTYQDPVCGWTANCNAPTNFVSSITIGVTRTMYCDPHASFNAIPLDLCVNSIIAAGWNISERFYSNIETGTDIPVYNFCTWKENQLTLDYFISTLKKYNLIYPTLKSKWYMNCSLNSNKVMHLFSMLYLHYLPAIIVDIFLLCTGAKPRLLKTYKKIHQFMKSSEYFLIQRREFQTDNVKKLWEKLSEADKKIFFFDMGHLDWDRYIKHYCLGTRQYLLNDPLETVPQALVRYNRLYWLHQFIKFLVAATLLKLLWAIIFYLYNI